MLPDVVYAKTMTALAADVSSISSKNLRDHAPVVVVMRIGFCAVQADRESWDYNRFMQARQGNAHVRGAFTRDPNTSSMEEIEQTDIGSTPDEVWSRLAAAVCRVSRRHFILKRNVVTRTINSWKNRLHAQSQNTQICAIQQ